ncbi:MFS transporter [Novispirillum sp. DQ9]|uniref:MFS transporter n=1 Tax=Novispirillum sp. DQ9 TaxID=3398612 RepID=UPI003C7CA9F9
MSAPASTSSLRGGAVVLACASVVLALSLGIRHSFGLFLQPVTMAGGWERDVFALAIALQNLVWGAAQPFAGLIADRLGSGKVIAGGTVLYVLGLAVMALPGADQTLFVFGAGLLVGLGLSGTTYPLVLGAVSRAVPAEKRSLAMGLAMGGAAFGQFIMLPAALTGIGALGWSGALVALALLATTMLPLALGLRDRQTGRAATAPRLGAGIAEALRHRGFQLLAAGFFVCGFQVVFIATHLPAFLADKGMAPEVGSTVLALIGLFNIAGTYYAGLWGSRHSKPRLLSGLYLARAVAIAAFAFLPISEGSAYAFGVVLGLFWLSTVPLTNGTIASLFGVANMATLGGVVFFAHQLGAFLGGWLGGTVYTAFGSYELAWAVAVGLSLIAALLNVPIRERAVAAGAVA